MMPKTNKNLSSLLRSSLKAPIPSSPLVVVPKINLELAVKEQDDHHHKKYHIYQKNLPNKQPYQHKDHSGHLGSPHEQSSSVSMSQSISSRSTPSLSKASKDLSSSSSNDSSSLLSSMITGLDIGLTENSCYNPSNTLPISSNRRPHTNIYSGVREELTTKLPRPSNLSLNKKHYLQTHSFLACHQDHQADNSSTNQKLNSAILTLGSATMFSSASLLTLPNSTPYLDHPTQQLFNNNKNNLSNGVSSSVPYLPVHQSPLTSHPLINITRTRALSRAKLKQSSQVSALLSGFALVAMVEMDIQSPSTIPLSVLMFFIITTTLLVSVHMIALMISTCILPHIESMNAMQDLALTLGSNNQQNSAGQTLHQCGTGSGNGLSSPTTNDRKEFSTADQFMVESSTYYGSAPHQKMRWYISIAWFFSTVIGIFLFILELVAIVWVKFWDHNRNPNEENSKWISDGKLIATASTLLLIPVLLALIYFAFHFYNKLVLLRYEMAQKVLDELNVMADGLSVCDNV